MNSLALMVPVLIGLLFHSCIATLGQTASRPQSPQPVASATTPPKLPGPAGLHGIGRIGYDWTDTTRPDRYSSDPKAHRELMVYLWYPTGPKQADVKGTYLPGAKQMDGVPDIQRSMRDEFESNWPFIVSGAIFSHAAENIALAKTPTQFPLIIFSHGQGGSGFEYTALIEDLVSRGYVVAAIEHTETALAVFFPDGRIIPSHQDSPQPGLPAEERFKRMVESVSVQIEEGAADVRFVLDRLTQLNAARAPGFPLAGRLDLTRVAAMGHSAGAEFAARACQLDARLKACVDLDGGMVPIAALPEYPDGATMKPPLLFLEAYHDEAHMGGTHEQHLEYFKKRAEQLAKCPPGTFAVVLRSPGMTHGSFSDYRLLAAGDHPDEIRQALHNLDLIETYIRAFLDRTLHHERDTVFDSKRAADPEAEVVAYGH
jgi:dienelactone hydrolase